MENPGKPGGMAIYQKSYYIAHHISFVRTEGVFGLLWETYVVKSCMKKIHLRVGFLQICGWCSQCVCVCRDVTNSWLDDKLPLAGLCL